MQPYTSATITHEPGANLAWPGFRARQAFHAIQVRPCPAAVGCDACILCTADLPPHQRVSDQPSISATTTRASTRSRVWPDSSATTISHAILVGTRGSLIVSGKSGESDPAHVTVAPSPASRPGVQKCYHKVRKDGEPCSIGYNCEKGLSCEAGSQVCRKLGVAGDSCHATRPCQEGFSCHPCT